jgi:hypothetical protein
MAAEPNRELEIREPRDPHDPRGPADGVDGDGNVVLEKDKVQLAAAKLYGEGFPRAQVVRILVDHLVPATSRHKPLEQKLSQARHKLRRWEQTEEFRDLIYKHAVVQLDLATPGILKGVASKAKRGRVDAARLVLEITGRHDPKGDQQPTQVAVVFQGVHRPEVHHSAPTNPAEIREAEDE